MARAAEFACREGLSGLEFAHGIPGTMGGGLFMNAGAYGGELCQVAQETAVMDYDGQIHFLSGAAQGFGYRTSAFQTMEGVIVRTVLQLQPGNEETIRQTMKELARRRRESQPLNYPSAGSTFKRPVGGYAAALIDEAGLKGLRVGGAMVSEKHAGFVVNDGGATCNDVLQLIQEIQTRVFEHSGIRLEPEVRLL
jgi:UDP-N-acetylmuramate dehydrogenase